MFFFPSPCFIAVNFLKRKNIYIVKLRTSLHQKDNKNKTFVCKITLHSICKYTIIK